MAPEQIYDVFLSHASPDKATVEELARELKRNNLEPFLDKWHLVPGEPWQEALEEALDRSQTFAVFIGPGGVGPWQHEEMRDALDARVRDKTRRLIPVLLPGALTPDEKALPRFLKRLTWVDFRNGLDNKDAFHRLVCGIKGIQPGESPSKGSAASSSIGPTMIGVPHQNNHFTGRATLLLRLHHQLQAPEITASNPAEIHGNPGVGKTQIATEYAYRFGKHYRFVLWINAAGMKSILLSYLSIAQELGLTDNCSTAELGTLAVKTWLEYEYGWLAIFDDVRDFSLAKAHLPVLGMRGKVLLVSPRACIEKATIQIPTWEPQEAAIFIRERTGINNSHVADTLAAELEYLPLALEQAASYIVATGVSIDEYISLCRHQGIRLATQRKPVHRRNTDITSHLSLEAAGNRSKASAELLIAICFTAPSLVPIELLFIGYSVLSANLPEASIEGTEGQRDFLVPLQLLEQYGLVERLPNNLLRVHQLTRLAIIDSIDNEKPYEAKIMEIFKFACSKASTERHRLALVAPAISYLADKYCSDRINEFDLPAHLRFSLRSHIIFYNLGFDEVDRILTPDEAQSARNLSVILESKLEAQYILLGREHTDTTFTAWKLRKIFHSLGDHDAESRIINELHWLLDCSDTSILSTYQRMIRTELARRISQLELGRR